MLHALAIKGSIQFIYNTMYTPSEG